MSTYTERVPATNSVIPSATGGWVRWSSLLLDVLLDVFHQPAAVLTIEQPLRNGHCVEVHARHGAVRIMARGADLNGVDERLLTLLGWVGPQWTLPFVRGDWDNLVETITATLVGIFGFSEQLPVEMRTTGTGAGLAA